jgi:uncharacterized lipoprotein YddW (UPF0748 family)
MKDFYGNCLFTVKFLYVLVAMACLEGIFSPERCLAVTEIRAVWMHPESQFSADPQKGKLEIHQFVERIVEANFNLILPWVRSEYVAALTDETYQKSIPIAKWDALGELIKVAHERGLQIHLWYSFTYYKTPSSPDFNSMHGGNPEWAARQIDELVPDKITGKVVPRRMANVCPLHPEAREWELNLIKRILERYPWISGVHIEEPGYSGVGNCVCDLCLSLFKSIYGFDETVDVNGPQAQDLKCVGTTAFVRQLRGWLKGKNSKLILSTNGGPSWQADRESGRDWKHWAQMGWLYFYTAQIYTINPEIFDARCQTIITDLGEDCLVSIGIAAQWSGGKNTTETVVKEIEIARRLGAKGVVIFSGQALTEEYLAALKAGPFSQAATLPTW